MTDIFGRREYVAVAIHVCCKCMFESPMFGVGN
jgi:hypothetical protein